MYFASSKLDLFYRFDFGRVDFQEMGGEVTVN